MKRMLGAGVLCALVASLSTVTPTAAAEQSFFEGSWRCQQGMSLNVVRGFGPWYVWRSTAGSEARAFIRKTYTGQWIDVGADSTGGWWSMTSPGWQGVALAFEGTYANLRSSEPIRQVFTHNSPTAMTIQTWRSGDLVGQVGCNR